MRRSLPHVPRRLATLAVLLTAAAASTPGCTTAPARDTPFNAGPSWVVTETWGYGHSHVQYTNAQPAAVVIDIEMVNRDEYVSLTEVAYAIARRPGILSVDGRINLNLPESEGFQGTTVEGDIVTCRQGHDPALTKVGDYDWKITIPVRSDEARQAIASGGTIVLDPNADNGHFTRPFGGLRFAVRCGGG